MTRLAPMRASGTSGSRELCGSGVRTERAARLQAAGVSTIDEAVSGEEGEARWGSANALEGVSGQTLRFGYRRLTALLIREGMAVNHKRVYRLYREESLAMRIRQRRRIRWSGLPPVEFARTLVEMRA